jgi:4-hydroxybenzoate polyprenyltransferase
VAGLTLFTKDRPMSPQLTLSSLFSVLALAGLCMTTGARDLAGFNAHVEAAQAELAPGLREG